MANIHNNENKNNKQAKLIRFLFVFKHFFSIYELEKNSFRQASSTLGSGNLRDIILLPYGEDENEWIAANSILKN